MIASELNCDRSTRVATQRTRSAHKGCEESNNRGRKSRRHSGGRFSTFLKRQIITHYRFNLNRMIDIAGSARAEVVLVVPASNLRDCSPFNSQHTDGLTGKEIERMQPALAMAHESLESEDYGHALKLLEEGACRGRASLPKQIGHRGARLKCCRTTPMRGTIARSCWNTPAVGRRSSTAARSTSREGATLSMKVLTAHHL